jgi:hypothetical protein
VNTFIPKEFQIKNRIIFFIYQVASLVHVIICHSRPNVGSNAACQLAAGKTKHHQRPVRGTLLLLMLFLIVVRWAEHGNAQHI